MSKVLNMIQKTAYIGNLGAEELYRFKHTVLTRAETRAQAEALFPSVADIGKDRKLLEKLFVQTPGAETMAPVLQKTAAIDAWFEKTANMTVAQMRYPELLKAAADAPPTPSIKKRGPSMLPAQAPMAGGSA